MKWAVLGADGELEVRDSVVVDTATLQDAVEGYFTRVITPHSDLGIFVNEEHTDREGNALPLNSRGTAFVIDALMPGDRIVGAMVFTGSVDAHGEITSLTDTQVSKLEARFSGGRVAY